jgi:hypothetical protein
MKATRADHGQSATLGALEAEIWSSFTAAERGLLHPILTSEYRCDFRLAADRRITPSQTSSRDGEYLLPLVARCALVGRRDDLHQLVAAGANPREGTRNLPEAKPEAALLAACAAGHADIVDDLLGWGCSPLVDDHYMRQNDALWRALYAPPQHAARLLTSLVAHGADPQAGGIIGGRGSFLQVAADRGNAEAVSWCLENGLRPTTDFMRSLMRGASVLRTEAQALAVIDRVLMTRPPIDGRLVTDDLPLKHPSLRDTLLERLTDLTAPAPRHAIVTVSSLAQTMHDVWRVVGGRRKTLTNESIRRLRDDQAIRERIMPLVVDAMTSGNPRAAQVLAQCGDVTPEGSA